MVLQWIDRVWSEIPAELIVKSFKSCGIPNALDGTEDEGVKRFGTTREKEEKMQKMPEEDKE